MARSGTPGGTGHRHRSRVINGATRILRVSEYRIDDLARAAGTTVRNVRVYQDRDLLPPPRRQGRRAIYSDAQKRKLTGAKVGWF